jgi:hypothetical protein
MFNRKIIFAFVSTLILVVSGIVYLRSHQVESFNATSKYLAFTATPNYNSFCSNKSLEIIENETAPTEEKLTMAVTAFAQINSQNFENLKLLYDSPIDFGVYNALLAEESNLMCLSIRITKLNMWYVKLFQLLKGKDKERHWAQIQTLFESLLDKVPHASVIAPISLGLIMMKKNGIISYTEEFQWKTKEVEEEKRRLFSKKSLFRSIILKENVPLKAYYEKNQIEAVKLKKFLAQINLSHNEK